MQTITADANNLKRILLDSSYQGISKLAIMVYDNTNGVNTVQQDSHRQYFLPRINLSKFNVIVSDLYFYEKYQKYTSY